MSLPMTEGFFAPVTPAAGTVNQTITVITVAGSQDGICGNQRRQAMNNIYKNAEGYPDYVAGEAIKAADKAPHHIRYLVRTFQDLAHLLGCEIEGRIAIKDKETGKVWR